MTVDLECLKFEQCRQPDPWKSESWEDASTIDSKPGALVGRIIIILLYVIMIFADKIARLMPNRRFRNRTPYPHG